MNQTLSLYKFWREPDIQFVVTVKVSYLFSLIVDYNEVTIWPPKVNINTRDTFELLN